MSAIAASLPIGCAILYRPILFYFCTFPPATSMLCNSGVASISGFLIMRIVSTDPSCCHNQCSGCISGFLPALAAYSTCLRTSRHTVVGSTPISFAISPTVSPCECKIAPVRVKTCAFIVFFSFLSSVMEVLVYGTPTLARSDTKPRRHKYMGAVVVKTICSYTPSCRIPVLVSTL